MRIMLPLIFIVLVSCRKERLTETTIDGNYSLVTVKESLPGRKDNTISYPYTNAQFKFTNANEVRCIIDNDTLFGTYTFVDRNIQNGTDGDGNPQYDYQRGLQLNLSNFVRSRTINWTLWDVRFRRTENYIIGHQDRSRGTYRFEFLRR